jgi:hypothetical protein
MLIAVHEMGRVPPAGLFRQPENARARIAGDGRR